MRMRKLQLASCSVAVVALIGRFDGADYIYVSEGVRVLDYAVDASPRPGDVPLYPSDHFPLFATLEFPRQNKTKKGIRE